MQNTKARFTIAFFALIVLSASVARADMINFTWQSSFAQASIAPDQPNQGAQISFLSDRSEPPPDFGRNQYEMGLASQSPSVLAAPATYTNKPFAMTLTLTDGPSGLSDQMTFHGFVNGAIWSTPPDSRAQHAAFSFSDGVQSATIGQDVYQITMLSGNIWGGENNFINAQIDVTHDVSTPEPSSLLLTVIALPMLGFARRKKPVQG